MPVTALVQGLSELLLALPEFDLINANIDAADELHAVVELPRQVQAYRPFEMNVGGPLLGVL